MPLFKFLREMKQNFMLHPVAAHFSNGVIPVAVLYLLLFLPTGDPFFEHTVIHLLIIVLLAVPFSFYSGIRRWKTRYKGAKAPVFEKKIKLSVLLMVLCVIAVSIRIAVPTVMQDGGFLFWIYVASLFVMLPTVVLLGHHGGKLAAGQRSEKFR
jgi:phosphatidylserine synthase